MTTMNAPAGGRSERGHSVRVGTAPESEAATVPPAGDDRLAWESAVMVRVYKKIPINEGSAGFFAALSAAMVETRVTTPGPGGES